MKNITTLFLLFLSLTLFSQAPSMKRDTGILKGASYEIQVPANWNKKTGHVRAWLRAAQYAAHNNG